MSPPPVLTIEDRQCFPIQAGLLALGRSYSRPLPPRIFYTESGLVGFASHDSGGSAPDLHGIPFSIPT